MTSVVSVLIVGMLVGGQAYACEPGWFPVSTYGHVYDRGGYSAGLAGVGQGPFPLFRARTTRVFYDWNPSTRRFSKSVTYNESEENGYVTTESNCVRNGHRAFVAMQATWTNRRAGTTFSSPWWLSPNYSSGGVADRSHFDTVLLVPTDVIRPQ